MLASAICLRLFEHLARAEASRTFWTAGSNSPIRMAMMAMTTSSSMSVNPGRTRRMTPSFFADDGREWYETEVNNPARGAGGDEPLRDVQVEDVRPLLGDRPLLLRIDVPLLRHELLRDDVGAP